MQQMSSLERQLAADALWMMTMVASLLTGSSMLSIVATTRHKRCCKYLCLRFFPHLATTSQSLSSATVVRPAHSFSHIQGKQKSKGRDRWVGDTLRKRPCLFSPREPRRERQHVLTRPRCKHGGLASESSSAPALGETFPLAWENRPPRKGKPVIVDRGIVGGTGLSVLRFRRIWLLVVTRRLLVCLWSFEGDITSVDGLAFDASFDGSIRCPLDFIRALRQIARTAAFPRPSTLVLGA